MAKKYELIRSTVFEETAGDDVFNASEIVEIDDGRFLFCDNNTNDALLELVLDENGVKTRPLARHPLNGLSAGAVDDMEGMALVVSGPRRWVYVAPSLSLKVRKKPGRRKTERGKPAPARSGLLRVEIDARGDLHAEIIEGFREWLLEREPRLAKAARLVPDDGGLNVEALAWDPKKQLILVGVRSPVGRKGPMVVRVRVRDVDGPWMTGNLELHDTVCLRIRHREGEQGIRCIEYDPARETLLVVVGNSTSASRAPFELYEWDGNAKGKCRHYPRVRFAKTMKPEGITPCTIASRDGVVFVDDRGGYAVLWRDDPRMA